MITVRKVLVTWAVLFGVCVLLGLPGIIDWLSGRDEERSKAFPLRFALEVFAFDHNRMPDSWSELAAEGYGTLEDEGRTFVLGGRSSGTGRVDTREIDVAFGQDLAELRLCHEGCLVDAEGRKCMLLSRQDGRFDRLYSGLSVRIYLSGRQGAMKRLPATTAATRATTGSTVGQ